MGLVCVGRVLPPLEAHRPNTTALDQKKICFLSPSPQGVQVGAVSNARGSMSEGQRLAINLHQGPIPIPTSPLGAVATPSP